MLAVVTILSHFLWLFYANSHLNHVERSNRSERPRAPSRRTAVKKTARRHQSAGRKDGNLEPRVSGGWSSLVGGVTLSGDRRD